MRATPWIYIPENGQGSQHEAAPQQVCLPFPGKGEPCWLSTLDCVETSGGSSVGSLQLGGLTGNNVWLVLRGPRGSWVSAEDKLKGSR